MAVFKIYRVKSPRLATLSSSLPRINNDYQLFKMKSIRYNEQQA